MTFRAPLGYTYRVVSSHTDKEIRRVIADLSETDKSRVLDFARGLKQTELPEGTPVKDLVPFFGCISEEYADQIEKDIEEAFERVDPNEWEDPA